MSTQTQPALAIRRVWTAAFLLSGDATQAEDAVADAILSTDTDDFETEAFMTRVLSLSIQRSRNSSKRSIQKTSEIWVTLPAELQHVLSLPLRLRDCFVLRVLIGLPRETCHQMLQVNDEELGNFVCLALAQLAAMGKP
jgi:DNA-directed RNA polymerase specialized sigma24 family protein